MEIKELEYIDEKNIEERMIEVEILDDNIKEKRFILNTGNEAQIEYLTNIINGELSGIIIECHELINIKISIEKYDITLYEKQGFYGSKYLSLQNDSTYSNNEKAQNYGKVWALNDRLKINIDGGFNSIIKFSVRYK
ncbi:hypothetical protein KAI04_04830 [Candidatus Pacearchaeota archaeon]|nr:hypothetical protein [Candidatus Pacearchaeota archaeon]